MISKKIIKVDFLGTAYRVTYDDKTSEEVSIDRYESLNRLFKQANMNGSAAEKQIAELDSLSEKRKELVAESESELSSLRKKLSDLEKVVSSLNIVKDNELSHIGNLVAQRMSSLTNAMKFLKESEISATEKIKSYDEMVSEVVGDLKKKSSITYEALNDRTEEIISTKAELKAFKIQVDQAVLKVDETVKAVQADLIGFTQGVENRIRDFLKDEEGHIQKVTDDYRTMEKDRAKRLEEERILAMKEEYVAREIERRARVQGEKDTYLRAKVEKAIKDITEVEQKYADELVRAKGKIAAKAENLIKLIGKKPQVLKDQVAKAEGMLIALTQKKDAQIAKVAEEKKKHITEAVGVIKGEESVGGLKIRLNQFRLDKQKKKLAKLELVRTKKQVLSEAQEKRIAATKTRCDALVAERAKIIEMQKKKRVQIQDELTKAKVAITQAKGIEKQAKKKLGELK